MYLLCLVTLQEGVINSLHIIVGLDVLTVPCDLTGGRYKQLTYYSRT